MAFIAGPQTFDSDSATGTCTYPRTPLSGAPFVSPNVFINGVPAQIYTAASVPAPSAFVLNPICLPGQGARVMQISKNTNVFINGQLFAIGEVAGTVADSDATVIAHGATRALTGPYLAETPPNKQVIVNPPV
tara:strand:- start:312 stop:710 length:399 start_codon:yes stop_codon:yes gene_type:complete